MLIAPDDDLWTFNIRMNGSYKMERGVERLLLNVYINSYSDIEYVTNKMDDYLLLSPKKPNDEEQEKKILNSHEED